MTRKQKDALNQARMAFKLGSYHEALDKYEYFFDHALDDDPSSLYGVRLSYCLNEWARLGKKFPPAKVRLEQKRDEALSLLFETREPERFHDYIAICEYLKCPNLPIEEFLRIHKEDKELSTKIVRFIWNRLVEEKLWEVCISYLNNPKEKYNTCLLKFDQAMDVCKSDPALGGESFEAQIKGWYVEDIHNLLLVLKHTSKIEELEYIRNISKNEMEHRGYIELQTAIDEGIVL